MQALILAGGKGTRLRPLTVYTPKPIVPILNVPFLIYQIEVLKKAGITEITLSLSYQPDKIQHVLGNGTEQGVTLHYITEPSPMGTAGAYKLAAGELRETTLVFNGDILTDIDVSGLISFHERNKAAATLATVTVDDPSRYGLVETNPDGRIVAFREKPGTHLGPTPAKAAINAGVYILEPEILDLIPPGTTKSFEYHIFPEISSRAMRFFGYKIDDYWLDIGTPANYLQAHHDLLSGKIQPPSIAEGAASDVATHAEVDSKSIVGSGCVVKPGARIINSVLGAGTHVEEKAVVENSVIWSHTRVAAAAEIRSSIIGRSSHIGRNAQVTSAVLGDKSTLTDYTIV
ncbi:MAG: NDP-sugar synthase [Pyrinomonadaceae bacterium]